MYNIELNISLKYLMIALMPILSLYEFLPLFNIGFFILFLIIIFKILRGNLRLKKNIFITMLILISINLIIGLFKYSDITNTINNTAGMIVFTFLICFLCNDLDNEKLYRAFKIVGIIATVFLLYQMFEYYIMDNVVSGRLPYLTPVEDRFKSIGWGRPTSFFYEPSHYSIYISPIYATSLLKKEYKTSLFFVVGLIFSTSAFGIIMVFVIPFLINIKKVNKEILKKIFLTLIGFVSLFLLIENISYNILNKLSLDAFKDSIRVFGTLEYIKYFNVQEIIFGLGINRLSEYFFYKGLIVPNYANVYIYSLFSFGLIGALIWLIYNFSLYKILPPKHKILFYILVLVSLSDQILFNRNLMYLLIWIYAFSSKEIKKYNHKYLDKGEYRIGNFYNH